MKSRERVVVGEQLVAGALDPVQARRGGLVHAALRVERDAQRLDLGLGQRAHHAADVLQLAALAFVVGDAARLAHGIGEIFRHRHALEGVLRQFDERLAELLQRVHLALQLGFAGAIVAMVGVVVAMLDRLDSGFAVHGRALYRGAGPGRSRDRSGQGRGLDR